MKKILSVVTPMLLIAIGLPNAALAKDITVDASGGGDFKTVQQAVDSVPDKNSERVRILIKPGTYEEQITVAKTKPMISFIGQGSKPEDTVLTYHLKASDPKSDGSGNVGTTGSSSTFIHADDFVAENVTFANSAGDNVGQAVAIKTTSDRLIFRNCRFLGFQDTLYPTGGRHYFKDCYVTGDTDFIFGNATAVFDHCTINSSDAGYVTAANTKPENAFGYVFLDCTLTASPGVKSGSVYLGRPWQWDRGSKAAVTFVRTKMGPHINPAGWHPWDAEKNTQPGDTTRFAEFGSTDLDGKELDLSKRVDWAKQLSVAEAAKLTVQSPLSGWDPTKE
ncbi:MAG TPA: pectinesterase family protein [Tepidisphaeraceae bacterium]|jgi:pectinesterase